VNRTQVVRTEGHATVAIRPVGPADVAALSDFFAGLSVESRYLRFFAPVTPARDLLHLLSGGPANVDAIVAVAAGVIVGHAMAADRPDPKVPKDPEEPGDRCGARATDVGVVVADAWQRGGVGAALMRTLVTRAQARGVTSLAMDVLPGNRQVVAMVIGHWPDAAVDHSPDSLDIRISLPRYQPRQPQPRQPQPRQPQPQRAQPRPASGQVRPLVTVAG
jgi:GNAT superfamily N-acetyltransferase